MIIICQVCGCEVESERASRKFCDACRKARKAAVTARTYPEWYATKGKAYHQQRRHMHPEWKQRNSERAIKWQEEHPEGKKRNDARYYQRHKDRLMVKAKEYAQANRERMLPFKRAALVRYRSRKANAEGNFTAAQFRELCEACNWRCAYCHERFDKLTPDHIHPISRGGSNDITNIIPACLSCNASKQDRTPLEYLAAITAFSVRNS